ncbi:MAG: OFA family MFS transporter [Syntrophomonadaceae bacterium]|nr:OFA family MFS transporter [Syntrophomonadaceae bacterium]
MLCNLCIGSAYAWSVFQGPLLQIFDWSPSQAAITFTLILVMMPISMVIEGNVQAKKGPTFTLFLGGVLFGIGVFLAGFTTSLWHLYLTHGVLAGFGVGTVYSCAVSNTVRWFPDKRGLASGLIAAGLGMGAFFFAPIGNMLIQSFGVLRAFNILGVIYLILIIGSSFRVKAPPTNYKPEGWEPPATAEIGVSMVNQSPREMILDPMFYVLWILYVMGAVAGLMIIGHASPIGQKVIGLSVAQATGAVSILSLANTSGRIFWGMVSDKLGRYVALAMLYATSAASMFYLTTVTTFPSFIISICLVGLCFGGLLGIFPTIVADMFGLKYLSQNYGIMFSAFSMAGVIGPILAGKVVEASGGYNQAFVVAAVMGCIGIALTLIIQQQLKKRHSMANKKQPDSISN